jgi:hypothetical protein
MDVLAHACEPCPVEWSFRDRELDMGLYYTFGGKAFEFSYHIQLKDQPRVNEWWKEGGLWEVLQNLGGGQWLMILRGTFAAPVVDIL